MCIRDRRCARPKPRSDCRNWPGRTGKPLGRPPEQAPRLAGAAGRRASAGAPPPGAPPRSPAHRP
eukprot:12615771-Alexandrium_andersonii.AAC.1